MNKRILLFCWAGMIVLSAIIAQPMQAQDITGQWNGILQAGVKLRIVFHIERSDTGYTGKLDSPDQNAFGIPLTSVSYENSLVKLTLKGLRLEYEGRINAEGDSLTGIFKQALMVFPMILTRERIEIKEMARPQEPKEPFPYYAADVKFNNTADNVTLAGTLTLPSKEGVFPAVILISGSGAQNRNEELLGHKPFLVISDYLTRNGIAVLRYDDRGYGESTGNFSTATSEDLARDVDAAITYLKTRKEINKKEIGLVGHSEGGIIAPMVAARSEDVAFIVLLAGTGIRGDQLLLLQMEMIARANGVSEEDISITRNMNRGAFDIVLEETNQDSLKNDLVAYIKKAAAKFPESDQPSAESLQSQLDQLTSPWMKYFLKYDPYPTLSEVKCPVLALNGSLDLQVPASANLPAIKKGLEEGGNKDVTIIELPGLNHLFQQCKTGSPNEYAAIEQTFSTEALKIMSDWMLKRFK